MIKKWAVCSTSKDCSKWMKSWFHELFSSGIQTGISRNVETLKAFSTQDYQRNLKLHQFADVAGKKRAVTRMGPGALTTLMEPKASFFFFFPFYCLKKQTWKIHFMIFRGLWSFPRAFLLELGQEALAQHPALGASSPAKSPWEKFSRTEDGVR